MLYVLLADGFEEIEAIAAFDIIKRGDLKIKLASIEGEYVEGAHGVVVKADMSAGDIDLDTIDGIILPGGMPGTLNLRKSERVNELINYCAENGKLLAAICAAPMILGDLGLLRGKKATCFPGYEDSLAGAEVCDDFVVTDGNIITGKGAGAALVFGAAIADYFKEGTGKKLLRQVQYL